MRRLLLNGSPRGKSSNSRVILSWLAEGLVGEGEPLPETLDIAGPGNLEKAAAAFREAQEAVLVLPLYTDSMPGIVAAFTNLLAELDPALLAGKRVGFVIHSGFPESAQSEPLAAYFARMSDRLGFKLLGVAVKAGSEGFRLNPSNGKSKAAVRFRALGRGWAKTGSFDPLILAALAKPRSLGPAGRTLFRLLELTGLINIYWNILLKKNGAWDRRFDRPYV